MNHTSSYETLKNLQKSKGKNHQELYDKYIRKGDEAIIAEDIISAEKCYQHADHYFRLMNDPNFSENPPPVQPPAPSRPMEELIAKALMGIKAERAARKEALLKQVREVAKALKAAREKKAARRRLIKKLEIMMNLAKLSRSIQRLPIRILRSKTNHNSILIGHENTFFHFL